MAGSRELKSPAAIAKLDNQKKKKRACVGLLHAVPTADVAPSVVVSRQLPPKEGEAAASHQLSLKEGEAPPRAPSEEGEAADLPPRAPLERGGGSGTVAPCAAPRRIRSRPWPRSRRRWIRSDSHRPPCAASSDLRPIGEEGAAAWRSSQAGEEACNGVAGAAASIRDGEGGEEPVAGGGGEAVIEEERSRWPAVEGRQRSKSRSN